MKTNNKINKHNDNIKINGLINKINKITFNKFRINIIILFNKYKCQLQMNNNNDVINK